ncbi:hypothetical protein BT67DRAFT_146995 [Trichocladium antarcticum]|uniref:Uncharacterized protein n=1 Tax=Trichocladium antarcticum TaxID=1450529 RepID=A0AAN6ZB18_9PEZI|nr:hypothetical protein BT67DRAFT_146995 [Trichocladium antarcticum]
MSPSPWDAVTSFGSGLMRRLSSLQRPVQLLNCAAALMSCLLLAGCSLPAHLVNIYLVAFAATAPPDTADSTAAAFPRLEIRVGYFSLCVRVADSPDWICGDGPDIRSRGIADPWNILKTADDYRTEVVSPALMIVSVAMTMVSMFVVSSFPIRKAHEDLMVPYGRKFVAALVSAPLFHTLTALAARGGGDSGATGVLHVLARRRDRGRPGRDRPCVAGLWPIPGHRHHVHAGGEHHAPLVGRG